MSALWHDLRLAARLLVRRPILTMTVVLSLGLAIGANTSIFRLVSTVLFNPLPYPAAHERVGVYRIDPGVTGLNPSASDPIWGGCGPSRTKSTGPGSG